jgi:hypothetical protein
VRKGHGAGSAGLRRHAPAGLWARWRRARRCRCDLRWSPGDTRPAFVAAKRRVLRCIDLCRFGVFDLDAYGLPREAALIIAGRRTARPGGSYTKLDMWSGRLAI